MIRPTAQVRSCIVSDGLPGPQLIAAALQSVAHRAQMRRGGAVSEPSDPRAIAQAIGKHGDEFSDRSGNLRPGAARTRAKI
jgi:hypothetical protein